MLYLAHFSFEEYQQTVSHGYFTCIVEAGDVDDATSEAFPIPPEKGAKDVVEIEPFLQFESY